MPRILFLLVCGFTAALSAEDRPNILWLSTEDISPHLACHGDPHAITPQLDRLAAEGTLFNRAYTTAGVCAPSRSAIITGVHQSSLGSQHMRSHVRLPDGMELFPTYLRRAGYHTSNNVKTDYQIARGEPATTRAWDEVSEEAHWRDRADPAQPFFAVFNFEGTHESGIANDEKYRRVTANLTASERQDAATLTTLPPYYADTPTNRENWKRNYELITALDHWVGQLIQQLKDDGLYENTIIFFWSDHGIGLPRAKRWLYESGTHVPLIVRTPAKFRQATAPPPGATDGQLVSAIDLAPTVLNLAGLTPPDYFEGRAFLGADLSPQRQYIYGARDRMDERYDIIRMVRDQRFRYIRNYEPLKTYYQYMNTPEQGATMAELRRLHEAGDLPPAAAAFFAPRKPVEELYDLSVDPHEVNNLATDPDFGTVLTRLREAHLAWVRETRDTGLLPEPLLEAGERELGSRYAILRQTDDATFAERLAKIAVRASDGTEAVPDLVTALDDRQPAIRYWGATGLGNVGRPAASDAEAQLRAALTDEENVVRVAAARALCRMEQPDSALPVLVDVLKTGGQWERLHAAIVLDEIEEMARPVIAEMRAALAPREEMVQRGKYTVRVINRALNQLEGTSRVVR